MLKLPSIKSLLEAPSLGVSSVGNTSHSSKSDEDVPVGKPPPEDPTLDKFVDSLKGKHIGFRVNIVKYVLMQLFKPSEIPLLLKELTKTGSLADRPLKDPIQ